MLVRELVEGQEIDQVLLVRGRRARDGRLELSVGARSGALTAVVGEQAAGCCEPGTPVRIAARHRAGRLDVHEIRRAREDEYALADLLDGPPRSAAGMEADL